MKTYLEYTGVKTITDTDRLDFLIRTEGCVTKYGKDWAVYAINAPYHIAEDKLPKDAIDRAMREWKGFGGKEG